MLRQHCRLELSLIITIYSYRARHRYCRVQPHRRGAEEERKRSHTQSRKYVSLTLLEILSQNPWCFLVCFTFIFSEDSLPLALLNLLRSSFWSPLACLGKTLTDECIHIISNALRVANEIEFFAVEGLVLSWSRLKALLNFMLHSCYIPATFLLHSCYISATFLLHSSQ